jgi:predicted nucleic acid-binding Zn ribbon protein
MTRKAGPQRLGEILSGFLNVEGLAAKLKHLEVYGAWEEIVGPAILPHTRIAGLAHHKLYVDVDSATQLHELRSFHKNQLLKDLRARVPQVLIRDIVFRPASPDRRQNARQDRCDV